MGFFIAYCLMSSGLIRYNPWVLTVYETVYCHTAKVDTAKKEKSAMPKRIVPLSDIQVSKAKPKDIDYRIADGGGLFLLITYWLAHSSSMKLKTM